MVKSKASKIASHIILIFVALIYLIPFYIVIITSLKESNALATQNPFIWFPKISQLSFQGYKNIFTTYTIFATGKSMIATGFKNTLIVLVPVMIGGMFASLVWTFTLTPALFFAMERLRQKLKKENK